MSAITAFLQKIEAGATHVVSVVESDVTTGVQRVIAAIHVMEGNLLLDAYKKAYKKVEADAVAEVNKIEADANAAKQRVAAKLAAVKSALGV